MKILIILAITIFCNSLFGNGIQSSDDSEQAVILSRKILERLPKQQKISREDLNKVILAVIEEQDQDHKDIAIPVITELQQDEPEKEDPDEWKKLAINRL